MYKNTKKKMNNGAQRNNNLKKFKSFISRSFYMFC